MPEIISAFWAQYGELLLEGTWETLIMVSHYEENFPDIMDHRLTLSRH